MDKKTRINNWIRAKEVRLIDHNGQQAGILLTEVALSMAKENQLDLVEVAPTADPPVCRIMDFGAFKYQQKKKEKEARKKQHIIQVKEIRLRPKIEQHDLEVKAKRAKSFLEKSDRVLVKMRFRGRELAHMDYGEEVMQKFLDMLSEIAYADASIRKVNRTLEVLMIPGKGKKG